MGQPFASPGRVQRFAPHGCNHTNTHIGTRIFLLVLSWDIGDLDMIIDYCPKTLGPAMSLERYTHFIEAHCDTYLVFAVPLAVAGFLRWAQPISSSPHEHDSNTAIKAYQKPGLLLGGSLLKVLQLYFITESHWSSGATICFPPQGMVFCILHKHTGPGIFPFCTFSQR